jgi:aminoglycoside phosphotransferase (APT) family kinase protein
MSVYESILDKIPVIKGWSSDKKYCVTTSDKNKYLLRIVPYEKKEHREQLFILMKQLETLGVPMCKPIEFGMCDEGFYEVHSWIEGEDAADIIPLLSDEKQYEYGLEAGYVLQRMHSIVAHKTQESWETKFNRKIDRNIQSYINCSIKNDKGNLFIEFIQNNRHLLKDRPQVFQHGDYHINNMMIDHNGRLQIIDFDRYDFGDPWEEFNRIVFSAQKTPLFASGIVSGYFYNEVPLDFWKLLAVYISSTMLSSIPWTLTNAESELNFMLKLEQDVLKWYDNMREVVPSWYERIYKF